MALDDVGASPAPPPLAALPEASCARSGSVALVPDGRRRPPVTSSRGAFVLRIDRDGALGAQNADRARGRDFLRGKAISCQAPAAPIVRLEGAEP